MRAKLENAAFLLFSIGLLLENDLVISSYSIKSCQETTQSFFRITIEGETSNREGKQDRKQHTHFDFTEISFYFFVLFYLIRFHKGQLRNKSRLTGACEPLRMVLGHPDRPPPAVPGSGNVPPLWCVLPLWGEKESEKKEKIWLPGSISRS